MLNGKEIKNTKCAIDENYINHAINGVVQYIDVMYIPNGHRFCKAT